MWGCCVFASLRVPHACCCLVLTGRACHVTSFYYKMGWSPVCAVVRCMPWYSLCYGSCCDYFLWSFSNMVVGWRLCSPLLLLLLCVPLMWHIYACIFVSCHCSLGANQPIEHGCIHFSFLYASLVMLVGAGVPGSLPTSDLCFVRSHFYLLMCMHTYGGMSATFRWLWTPHLSWEGHVRCTCAHNPQKRVARYNVKGYRSRVYASMIMRDSTICLLFRNTFYFTCV